MPAHARHPKPRAADPDWPADVIVRALQSGLPILTLFAGTPDELAVRLAQAGEVIADPQCSKPYRAQATGVHVRTTVEQDGDIVDLAWLYLLSVEQFRAALKPAHVNVSHADLREAAMSAAWQAVHWQTLQREMTGQG